MLKPPCYNDHHAHNEKQCTMKQNYHYTKPTHATTVLTKNAPYAKVSLKGATRYADSPADICFIHFVTANTAAPHGKQDRTHRLHVHAVAAVGM